MQTGSVLTLNFYSNPIDVMIGDDQTIYLNWKHYCDMIGCDPEVAPHNFTVGEFDVAYIAFSYTVLHADRLLVDVEDRLFADLIREEFPGYIIKELGLIREMLPMISLPYHMYDAGIFQHGDKMYVLVDKLKRFTNLIEPHIPLDVPRFPIMIKVAMPRTGFIEFGGRPEKDETAYPTWMVEVDSLPYIIESTYHNHPPFRAMTNGTHSCQIAPNTKTNQVEDRRVNVSTVLFGKDEEMSTLMPPDVMDGDETAWMGRGVRR